MLLVPEEQVLTIFRGTDGATSPKVSAPFSKPIQESQLHLQQILIRADIKLLSAEDLIQVLSDGFLLTNLFHLQRYRIVHVTMLP